MKFLRFNVGFLLALAIFFTSVVPHNVQASTLTNVAIDEVFDRFHYSMNVEWDQKDEKFKEMAAQELKSGLLALEASGISMETIQKYMETNLLDAKTQQDYQRLLAALKGQNVSQKEATQMTMKFMENSYSRGLHFNGEGHIRGGSKLTLVVVVLLVVVVTHLLFRKKKDDNHDDGDTIIIIVD